MTIEKTNWPRILIVLVVATISGVVIFFQNERLSKELASLLEWLPAPLPEEIDPNFLTQINECFIPAAAVYGYNLRITSGLRSKEEQEQLYNQGRTENGHIVSWAPVGRSIHNYGFAVDVVDRKKGYDIDWEKLANIAAFCDIKQDDTAHFEYRDSLNTAQFRIGQRPPPLTLPCTLMDLRAKAGQPLTIKDLKSCGAPNFSK